MSEIFVVILAAGMGKRMGNPDRAKVLTPLRDKPLLGYVLETAQSLRPKQIVVIAGHQRQAVANYATSIVPECRVVIQEEQRGTGHAVLQTEPVLGALNGTVLILSGDVPLLSASTLRRLLDTHTQSNATATVLTAVVDDPTGYGRIIRDESNTMIGIIEQKDATETQQKIREINSGVYVVQSTALFDSLHSVQNTNAQSEYYLTDIIAILKERGLGIASFCTEKSWEVHGINTPADLQQTEAILRSTHD